MSSSAAQPLDLDTLPLAVREAFLVMQAKVAGLEAHTERQDYLIAELRHALYGKRSEQLIPTPVSWLSKTWRRLVAEAEAAGDALHARNADGTQRRPAAKRNLGHLPDHLPRIEQVIEPAHKVCPLRLRRYGEDRRRPCRTAGHHPGPFPGDRDGSRYACRRCGCRGLLLTPLTG